MDLSGIFPLTPQQSGYYERCLLDPCGTSLCRSVVLCAQLAENHIIYIIFYQIALQILVQKKRTPGGPPIFREGGPPGVFI